MFDAPGDRRGVAQPPIKEGNGKRGALIGAIIGGSAAAATTYWAAREYGKNENVDGSVCGACFAYWGTFTIPAGAGIGALVGYLFSHGSSSYDYSPRVGKATVSPIVLRRGGGVFVSMLY